MLVHLAAVRLHEELAGHRFIDHGNQRRVQRVVLIEIAAGDQRRFHGDEESGADRIGPHDHILPRFRHIPFDVDDLVRGTSADGRDIGEARGADSGNGAETLLQFLVKRQAPLQWNARVARVDTDEQNLVLVEACIDRGELRERLEHEPGPDQKDQRQSDLRRDQHLPEAEPGVRLRHAARIALHGGVRIDVHALRARSLVAASRQCRT